MQIAMLALDDNEVDPHHIDGQPSIKSSGSLDLGNRTRSAFAERRLRDRTRLVRSVALSAALTLLGVIATAATALSASPLALLVVSLASVAACFSLAKSVDQLNRRQTLWIQWPRESEVAVSEAYDADLAELRIRSRKWEIPMLVSLGAACAIGGAWALASGQWAIGSAIWITMLGCALGASNGEPGSELGEAEPVSEHQLPLQVHAEEDLGQVDSGHVAVNVLGRCQLAANAELMVITDVGIDVLETGSAAWEALGNRNLSASMTSKLVFDAIEGSSDWRDLADIELARFDAFVDEHGYDAVAQVAGPEACYTQDSVAFAGIYQRRYVSGYYFEIELFDGSIDSRNLIADDERLEALRSLLLDLGYAQRFRETFEVA